MLEAAEAEFAEQGFEAATMDRVAATAGVSKSHLYYHFDSKDELLAELFAVRAEEILADKNWLFEGEDALTSDLMQKMLTEGIDRLLASHPRFLRIAVLECFRPGGRADLVFELLKAFSEDTVTRFRAYGIDVDAEELGSAITWFAVLPIFGELLVGGERARVLGLDPATQHLIFTRQLEQLYTTYLGRLTAAAQEGETNALGS